MILMLSDAMLLRDDASRLTRQHGFPVRALLPNRWGKLNVKWLDEIEVVDQSESGYWEERGWNGMGTVNPVVKISTSNRLSDGRVQLGGHAYAGTDGIRAVLVSLDGGETWDTATLSDQLPDLGHWRHWTSVAGRPLRLHCHFEPGGPTEHPRTAVRGRSARRRDRLASLQGYHAAPDAKLGRFGHGTECSSSSSSRCSHTVRDDAGSRRT